MRWYLEDYLQRPQDPAPLIAERVTRRMKAVGLELFQQLFEANRDTIRLWNMLCDTLSDTRIEIITGIPQATSIPWELLREPQTETPLALTAQAFVRAPTNPARFPQLPQLAENEKIRILLVICRPGKDEDVPFRSVASHILKGLTDEARDLFDLQVLRPPTFSQLSQVLRQAKANGQPYHIVHFDGHGTYADPSLGGFQISRIVFGDDRPGQHGYLVFENANLPQNLEMISGPRMGNLLSECHVPVLVLNACRSAHAEAPEAPQSVEGDSSAAADDSHSQVRALGSLAQEVVDAGVAGIVAMRYNVYVSTAAKFIADLYGALTQGQSLGEAVTLGRKQLFDDSRRGIAYDPIELQDWPVPIVYEAAPIQLFPKVADRSSFNISLQLPTSNIQRMVYQPVPMSASTAAMRPCWRSTALSIRSILCCCGHTPEAARRRRRWSLPAGMPKREG